MHTTPSFVAYIDESGDEGFCFGAGTSNWFVLSALIVRKEKDAAVMKGIVDDLRMTLNKPGRKKLKFRKLKPTQRTACVERICAAPVRAITVLFHKPSLTAAETFQKPHRLYFYAVRFLLERVSWFCRDNRLKHDKGDGGCAVIFDERKGMKYANMKAYFRLLRQQRRYNGFDIEWSVISSERISSSTASRHVGLQVVDAVAGSFFCAVDRAKGQGVCEYALCLKPIVYRHRGRWRGYGVKAFPGTTTDPDLRAFLESW